MDLPSSVRLFGVTKAIVQTVGPALPKFDSRWRQNISAPVNRHGNGLAVLCDNFFEPAFQEFAVRDYFALFGNPRRQAVSQRPNLKIGLGFFARKLGAISADAYLPLQLRPPKIQRGIRILRQLRSLEAVKI